MPGAFIPSLPIFLSGIRIQPLGVMEISNKFARRTGLQEKPHFIKHRKMPFESTYSQTELSKERETIKNQMNLMEPPPYP